ncbi:MAG: glycosyltransferase [Isosphaeraceae bacterium]
MIIAGLRSSSFVGGPERQMLGLAGALSPPFEYRFLLFSEGGRCSSLLGRVRKEGLVGIELTDRARHLPALVREVAAQLRRMSADLLCCYGYKGDLVGVLAARRVGIPVVGVAQGWTSATFRVRMYQRLDRLCLRRMDRVVCVSGAQSEKVRRVGVDPGRIAVIRDAVHAERFGPPDPADRESLEAMFARRPTRIIGAAGRLSPEKGFGVLVEAAAIVARSDPGVGFVHFGDGPLREAIWRKIEEAGLGGRFVLAGFRNDLDRYLPHWDLSVLPSFTEGLPNVVLESYAAGVPVVATSVGGTPEAVTDGVDGFLVPPGSPAALADRILDMLRRDEDRRQMGLRGRERIARDFTFRAQALNYQTLFEELAGGMGRSRPAGPQPVPTAARQLG